MRRESVKPDVISFNAAISTCEKKGQWQYVAPLFVITERLKAFNSQSFGYTVGAFAKAGHASR
eukprot:9868370-Karenia_brevis.AAC.1